MKKLLAWLVLPVFFNPLTIISTEQELVLTKEEQLDLFATPAYFTSIPANPRLYADTASYLDKQLTQLGPVLSLKDPLTITGLEINDQLVPVFSLKTGGFIPASQLMVFDDQELSREELDKQVWLKAGALVYDKPYVIGAKTIKTDLKAYQAVQAREKVVTYSGTYYYLDKKGWVSEQDLYEEPMAVVQDLLAQKYNKENLGIYVRRLDDGLEASVNPDKLFYSASVAKLAPIYETQRQLDLNQIQLTDKLKYVAAVNDYEGAYDPMGTGQISKKADDKDYTIEQLLQALTKHSDNVASNMLGYYVADQYSKTFETSIKILAGGNWDMTERDLSAKTAGVMMAQLYDQQGLVLDYLSETAFDNTRISKDIAARVAHKTGDAGDFRHDVAIVYADRPFVLSVFTEKASYEDITAIANDVYKILK